MKRSHPFTNFRYLSSAKWLCWLQGNPSIAYVWAMSDQNSNASREILVGFGIDADAVSGWYALRHSTCLMRLRYHVLSLSAFHSFCPFWNDTELITCCFPFTGLAGLEVPTLSTFRVSVVALSDILRIALKGTIYSGHVRRRSRHPSLAQAIWTFRD